MARRELSLAPTVGAEAHLRDGTTEAIEGAALGDRWWLVARARAAAGDSIGAVTAIEQTLALVPDDPEARASPRLLRASLALAAGRAESARDDALAALAGLGPHLRSAKANVTRAEAYATLADALVNLGHVDDATAVRRLADEALAVHHDRAPANAGRNGG